LHTNYADSCQSIIKFNHHTWAALTLWWCSCDVCGVVIDKQNAELNGLRWTTRSQSQQYASGVDISQHVFVQMADTSNTTSDGHQLAIHKLADWTKLHVLTLFFFDCLVWQKKRYFYINVTSQGKAAKQNGCRGKILYGWRLNSVLHLPVKKYYTVALNLPKLLSKIYWPLFLWTQCICRTLSATWCSLCD